MSEYPRAYPVSGGGGLNEHDYNALRDRYSGITLNGVRSYHYNVLVRVNGGHYEAIDSVHDLIYGGSSDVGSVDGEDYDAVVTAVLANLSAGIVWLQDLAFNYTLTIPENVTVVECLNGLTREFINSANSQGSPYTISIDTVNPTYILVQDNHQRFINNWLSTDAYTVFHHCSTALLTIGGRIQINTGTYTFTTGEEITGAYNISYVGEGSGSNFALPNTDRANRKQCVRLVSDGVATLFKLVQCQNVLFEGIAFDGADETTSIGILSESSHTIHIHRCYFMGFTSNAVKFTGYTEYSGDNWVTENVFSIGDDDESWHVGIGFQGNYTTLACPSENTVVWANCFYSYKHKGIAIKFYEPITGADTGPARIDSIRILENQIQFMEYGIHILGDDGSFFENNEFENNGTDIVISGTYQVKSRFIGNRNTIPTTPLTITRTNTKDYTHWHNNPGYVNENSGIGYSNTSYSQTVTHNLDAVAADVPSNIVIFAQTANGETLAISNITTTQFTVTNPLKTIEKIGRATNIGDGATIAHGLGEAPTNVLVASDTVTSGGKCVLAHWAGAVADASTFTVAINDTDNSPIASGINVQWRASVQRQPVLYSYYWYAKIWCYP